MRRPMTGCASSALSDRGDNALQLAGDGFGDRLQRRISNMLHGYGRVDGGDLDPAAADILHDDVARQHRSDLVIGGQRLVRQRRVTRAEDPILPEIEVELFLHRRLDIDFGQNAKALGFERLDDAFYRGGETPAHGLGDIVLHLNPSTEPGARRFVCAIWGSGIAATDRNDGDTEDNQSDHKHADASEAAHSVTHSPSPVSAHHAAAALTGTVGLRLGNGRQTQGREREYAEQKRWIAKL